MYVDDCNGKVHSRVDHTSAEVLANIIMAPTSMGDEERKVDKIALIPLNPSPDWASWSQQYPHHW